MADDGWFSGFPGGGWGAATVGAGGLGVLSDIYAFVKNQQERGRQSKAAEILGDPAKLAAYIQRFQTPMSRGAIDATNRDLGANWAVQTGGAPGGAMNQYTADAFAKLENARQQDATAAALRALTGVSGAVPANMPMGATGEMLRALLILKQLRGQQPTTPGITSTPMGDAGSSAEVLRDRTAPADPMADVQYPELAGARA